MIIEQIGMDEAERFRYLSGKEAKKNANDGSSSEILEFVSASANVQVAVI